MEAALIASALALGLAGAPHCVAMCAAPCAAVVGRGGATATAVFHAARATGYAIAGALAAASVNSLAVLGEASPALRPLWSLVHMAALALGVWLAVTGHQPAWLERIGLRTARQGSTPDSSWKVVYGPARAAGAGALWVAWPCGLLQSAVLVAALANSAAGGAAVMVTFAIATGAGLTVAPWLWRRLGSGGPRPALLSPAVGVRVAGTLLAAASFWSITRGIWPAVAAYCGF